MALNRDRDGNFEIYSTCADGSNVTLLTNNTVYDWVPMWSPSGRQIVFSSRRNGSYEIYVMNADGSNETRLTVAPDVRERYRMWSPAAGRMSFCGDRDTGRFLQMYARIADGPTQITDTATGDNGSLRGSPGWSAACRRGMPCGAFTRRAAEAAEATRRGAAPRHPTCLITADRVPRPDGHGRRSVNGSDRGRRCAVT